MSTAFLINEDKVLLMKKETSKVSDEPFWTGLGGHLEPYELNSPMKACYREILEESGIAESDIEDLKLRYILLRIKNDEIRQQFVYFGRTTKTDFVNSDEGELHWQRMSELKGIRFSRIVAFMLEDYQSHPNRDEVMVGTITMDAEMTPTMQWSELRDPLVF
ncbi:NUDIX domain-containing protein [Paenibacillus cellulosilyticus]|nr:NUDIX domain-containing protein [Paenibacillus cellulosilyticus]